MWYTINFNTKLINHSLRINLVMWFDIVLYNTIDSEPWALSKDRLKNSRYEKALLINQHGRHRLGHRLERPRFFNKNLRITLGLNKKLYFLANLSV